MISRYPAKLHFSSDLLFENTRAGIIIGALAYSNFGISKIPSCIFIFEIVYGLLVYFHFKILFTNPYKLCSISEALAVFATFQLSKQNTFIFDFQNL